MVFEFLKLQILKSTRSVSLSRNLLGNVFIGLFSLLIFLYIIGLAISMKVVIEKIFGSIDPINYINANLFNLFVIEFMYRFFIQKVPTFDLAGFLHLPIQRSKIVNYLLIRSIFSPLNIIFLILFAPFALIEVASKFGSISATSWLISIVVFSWIIHWLVLFFKTRFGDSLLAVLIIFTIGLLNVVMGYYDWLNPGLLLEPVFSKALISNWIPLFLFSVSSIIYYQLFKYYLKNAYLEELIHSSNSTYVNGSIGFLSKFGLIGEMANLEWKLIIRHKKSRSYLFISMLFLFYGLIFYGNPTYADDPAAPYMYIFVATFVTGVFMIQYGQLFLSWNSASFDFYMSCPNGLASLIRGKYLLFISISLVSFLLTVPYVYYGFDVLITHAVLFLFNIGVTIHLVINLALWKPKPMDLDKGSFFNYEGIGIAQYLMIIPMVVIPYSIYLPVNYFYSHAAGLAALGIVGTTGIIFSEKLIQIAVDRLIRNKYIISTSFRQEL